VPERQHIARTSDKPSGASGARKLRLPGRWSHPSSDGYIADRSSPLEGQTGGFGRADGRKAGAKASAKAYGPP
jgi:hypothetical protein